MPKSLWRTSCGLSLPEYDAAHSAISPDLSDCYVSDTLKANLPSFAVKPKFQLCHEGVNSSQERLQIMGKGIVEGLQFLIQHLDLGRAQLNPTLASNLTWLLLKAGAPLLVVVGCAIGLGGGFAASRLVRSFLFGVSAFDPMVMAGAAFLLLLLALAASLVPAWRAVFG